MHRTFSTLQEWIAGRFMEKQEGQCGWEGSEQGKEWMMMSERQPRIRHQDGHVMIGSYSSATEGFTAGKLDDQIFILKSSFGCAK